MLEDLGSLLGWAVMTMASLAKIIVPMYLVGKPVRTPRLWSFHALFMSHRWEILRFPVEPLIRFLSLSTKAWGLAASLTMNDSRLVHGHQVMVS